MTGPPFAPGSISLRLYPHLDLQAPAIVEELRAQARLAIEHGFDGIMTSEHHGGFAGYLPNPLQAAGWLLEAMPSGWAAPCPLLLTLRPAALVAEEVAWLAARFPGRVGVGLAAGALPQDFEIMRLDTDDLARRFAEGLAHVAAFLGGHETGRLAGDPAIARCADEPVPVVSAAASTTAARRAARVGAGILLDSLSSPERCRRLSDAYREAGGAGPVILIRRACVGEAPRRELDDQVDVYRSYSPEGAQRHWQGEQLLSGEDAAEVAADLADARQRAGADCLNLRVHVPGVTPAAAREQIVRLGDDVLPRLREAGPIEEEGS